MNPEVIPILTLIIGFLAGYLVGIGVAGLTRRK